MGKFEEIISSQKKIEERVNKIENLLERSDNDNTELDKTILMVYYINLQYASFHKCLTINFYLIRE